MSFLIVSALIVAIAYLLLSATTLRRSFPSLRKPVIPPIKAPYMSTTVSQAVEGCFRLTSEGNEVRRNSDCDCSLKLRSDSDYAWQGTRLIYHVVGLHAVLCYRKTILMFPHNAIRYRKCP